MGSISLRQSAQSEQQQQARYSGHGGGVSGRDSWLSFLRRCTKAFLEVPIPSLRLSWGGRAVGSGGTGARLPGRRDGEERWDGDER